MKPHDPQARPVVWLVSPYELRPRANTRPQRWENLSTELIARGFDVVSWISAFSHRTKAQIAVPGDEEVITDHLRVKYLRGIPYRTNLAARRFLSEIAFALHLLVEARRWPAPACIVTREPPALVGAVCTYLARKRGSSLIVDLCDLWPELFRVVFKPWQRVLLEPLFWLISFLRKVSLKAADAIVAHGAGYFSISRSAGAKVVANEVIYNGFNLQHCRELSRKNAAEFRKADSRELWALFVGTLGNNYDIDGLIESARMLREAGSRWRIIVAGDGPLLGRVMAAVEDNSEYIRYLGCLPFERLVSLCSAADVGLMPYIPGSTVEIPDKFYDYLSAGLACVSSCEGEVRTIMRRERCGVCYQAGSAESLVSVLRELERPGDTLETMQRRSYRLAEAYSAEVQFPRYADIVETVVTGGRSRQWAPGAPGRGTDTQSGGGAGVGGR